VLDPEPDKAIARFDTDNEAVEWIARELETANESGDDMRVDLLKRFVVAPYDPERDAA
jgi:hypothetical protein